MTEMIDGTEYVTVTDAAAELSTTETRILMLLKQRALEGTLSEQGWFITKSSLDCFDRHGEEIKQQFSCRTGCAGSGCACN